MSLYYVQKFLFELNRSPQLQAAYSHDRRAAVDGYTLTDDEIEELTDHFQSTAIEKISSRVIKVEPTIVLEIAFDKIRPSKRHDSGLALRFPRMARWRKARSGSFWHPVCPTVKRWTSSSALSTSSWILTGTAKVLRPR